MMDGELRTSILVLLAIAPLLIAGLWLIASESFLGLLVPREKEPGFFNSRNLESRNLESRNLESRNLESRNLVSQTRNPRSENSQTRTFRTRPVIGRAVKQLLAIDSFIAFSILIIAASATLVFLWQAGRVVLFFVFAISLLTILAHERGEKRKAQQQLSNIDQELAQFVQLISLLVSSGVSPLKSLELLSKRSNSLFAKELQRVIFDVERGKSVPEAFDSLLLRVGTPGIRRFVTNLLVAIERGAPLVPVMISLVRDFHGDSKTTLMRQAGKSEIALMIPVVFLLLPISVLFALFPSMHQLQFFFS